VRQNPTKNAKVKTGHLRIPCSSPLQKTDTQTLVYLASFPKQPG